MPHGLTPAQRAKVANVFNGRGGGDSTFVWSRADGPYSGLEVDRLTHLASGGYFTFDVDPTTGSPAFEYAFDATGQSQTRRASNWDHELARFDRWVADVLDEPNVAPARWRNGTERFDSPSWHRVGIDALYGRLNAIELAIKRLAQSIESIGRKDLVLLALGLLLPLLLPFFLPRGIVQRITDFVWHWFGTFRNP